MAAPTILVADDDGAIRTVVSQALGRAGYEVRLGWLSHSMTPPWSPMIFATSAKPRPLPLGFDVTNGSNR